MDMIEDRTLFIIKDILLYWMREVLEKGIILILIIIATLIILGIHNPYGRYFDAWLEADYDLPIIKNYLYT